MKKKIFITSDEHGDYRAMKEAEKEAGYDESNPNHFRISLGDCFDRCPDNLAIYEYYKRLCDEGKMIVINSNHFPFLIDYLDGTSLSPFNYQHNGVDETLADFLHETKPFESWCIFNDINTPTYGDFAKWIEIARKEINEEYPKLLPWLKSLPNYVELKDHICVHASIDTEAKDWRKPHCIRGHLIDWDALNFDDGSFFGKNITNTDKTIIIGHFGTGHLRRLYDINDGKDEDDILIRDDGKVIAIDATTCISHKVNMLVIEDEFLE